MIDLIAALLGYPLPATVSFVEALWVAVAFVAWLLAARKYKFAHAYERGRIAAGQNGDRRISSRMNLRTAVMAFVVATVLLLVGANSMMLPPRPDEYADQTVYSVLALLLFECWFTQWLIFDWRDALELRERLERAFADSDIAAHAQDTADHAQETADQAQGVADAIKQGEDKPEGGL